MIFRILVLAVLLVVHGLAHAQTTAEKAGFSPVLTIYLARGPANSCGTGCDRWIAVEGEVDAGSAARMRRFLAQVKDTGRPIYFHSPGGLVEPSFAIGRLLRSRKAIARVGSTTATACAGGSQVDAACLRVKNAGGEVEAELTTRRAMCNSACSYLFLGATTREVAPDAAMGVHNSRLKVNFQGHPSPQQVADYRARSMARADRDRAAYVASMGITGELTDLIKTVKFENAHVLTRTELYRFGIDARPFVETAWTMEGIGRGYVRKIALRITDAQGAFQTLEWRLFCENKDRARLMFVREFDQAAGARSVVMTAGGEKPVAFGKFPARIGKYQVWSNIVPAPLLKAMLAAPRLTIGEGSTTAEGKTDLTTFDLDTDGLEPGWTRLKSSCAAPVTPAPVPGMATPNATAAPVP